MFDTASLLDPHVDIYTIGALSGHYEGQQVRL